MRWLVKEQSQALAIASSKEFRVSVLGTALGIENSRACLGVPIYRSPIGLSGLSKGHASVGIPLYNNYMYRFEKDGEGEAVEVKLI